MAGGFSREKGKRAEREVVKLLQPVVTEVYRDAGLEVPMLERNLMQSHKGGHDIVGLDWMALEVKHHETLQVSQWWEQAKRQAGDTREPVLIYRQNRVKWRVMVFGQVNAGNELVVCPCEISLESFLEWFEKRLLFEIGVG